MIADIPEPLLTLLRDIGAVGGKGTYLVGGFVRDLLLKRPSLDMDIVVEGDAIRVAKAICERWNGTLEVHPQFRTATVTPADANLPKVDFVTARRETYHHAGTLPTVADGTITDDLRRRDFSINALALSLASPEFGDIVDVTGGTEDLARGEVRALHRQSYTDDPTRIFRAFRYAVRYGFSIPDTDVALMREALPVLRHLSGERIRNEIDRILLETNAPEILTRLTQLSVWATIFEGGHLSNTFTSDLDTAERAIAWASEHLTGEEYQPQRIRWIGFLGLRTPAYQVEALVFRLVLPHQLQRLISRTQAQQRGVSLDTLTAETFAKLGLPLSDRVHLNPQSGKCCIVDPENEVTYVRGDGSLYRIQTPLTAYTALVDTFAAVNQTLTRSEVYRSLKSYPLEALAIGAVDPTLPRWKRQHITDYLSVLRKIKPLITGKDLVTIGEKPGKVFQARLWELFAAQLDGKITKKEEAYSYLRRINNG